MTVLNAVMWTISAVKSIKPETVRKCFLKAGFPPHFATTEAEESDEELSEPDLGEFHGLVKTLCPQMTGEEFLNLDVDLETHNEDMDIQSIISAR